MVMHARKLPRLNDGYFDRNQAHSYLNSNKFSSSKSNYGERYGDKVRDSPSNGGNYRSDSPDSQHSPRDRSYHNKSSYSQRLKERERDASRSPKDKNLKSGSRDYHQSSSYRSSSENTDHRSNHDRNNTEDVKEKRIQVGDWSEHMSSSGKKYYYNCKTEVSQWEKPKDWLEWEKQQGIKINNETNKTKERSNYEKSAASTSSASSSSSRTSEKHSSDRNSLRSSSSVSSSNAVPAHYHHHSRTHDGRHHASKSSGGSRNFIPNEQSQGHRSQSQHRNDNRARSLERNENREQTEETSTRREIEKRSENNRKSSEDSQMQDMEISPDCTPTGGGAGNAGGINSQSNSQPQSQIQTPVAPTTTSQPPTTQASVSLANLPKLLSQLAGNKCLPNMDKTELSAQEALQTLQTALLLTRQVSLAQTNMTNQSPHSSVPHNDTSPFLSQKSPLPVPMPSHTTSAATLPAGGSTSSVDGKARNDEERGRTSPGGSEYSHRSSRRGSPTSSISSLHSITPTGTTSLVSAALRPTAPIITPSLANYVRDDLINHITGWQADHAERQANRYSEDAHSIGSLNSTKVSAELKMARSLVRVAEIQATLQEQRILFLRQQIKELEDWKSQNSFMSDS